MNRHLGIVRALMASAAIAAAVALTGCQTDELADSGRAMQPLSSETRALVASKNMSIESPILVRIFKEESELEVWKKDYSGRFALLKTYPICRWSGDLGPKIRQGDRQAPEGFYTITPGQMNPKSQYYLAFNLGFPNAFDRAHGRSGAFLMVHGDCSSAGCYSMSDAQMAEIYALGREAFLGGQKSFQVQAYPFRMTPLNLARHRNNPHFAFWRMLKEGNDHFEVTRQEPKVDVCERRYVFDAAAASGPFYATGSCPRYQVPERVAAAVQEKREQDEQQFAALVNQGTRTVAIDDGSDGGMHPSFVAKLQPETIIDTTGRPAAYTKPGSGLPTLVRLPRALAPASVFGGPTLTQVASADPSQPIAPAQSAQAEPTSGNFFTRLLSGNRTSEPANQETDRKSASSSARRTKAKATPTPRSATRTAAKTTSTARPSASKSESAKDQSSRKVVEASASRKPSTASAFAGSATSPQPVVPTTNFDTRFGGWR
ncbi:MAG: hypothetical protein R3D52_03885 [Xanthobacteraceae bacterium]